MNKLDLGCGPTVKPGFIGVDNVKFANPNIVHCEFETDRLPFFDDSVDEIFSSHCFEHVLNPFNLLNEMLRVCVPGAKIEIWTPYGHSNDAFICGHQLFYTPLHWEHYIMHFPDVWTPNRTKHYNWYKTKYHLTPDAREDVAAMGLSLAKGVKYLNNVASEWGVFLEVLPGPGPNREDPENLFVNGR